jgi:hypothetical protein
MDAVLRTLLLHAGQGWSLRETAVQTKLAGIAEVSDVALMDRLPLAEPWLRGLCEGLWKANGVCLEPGFNHRVVRLLDATTVREPGKTGSQWRIHYSLRLPSLECDHFELTPARGKDTGEKLGRFSFRPGELVLADAGYSHPPGIAAVTTQKAELCLRLNPASVPLCDLDLRPFPLATKIRLLAAGEIGDWPVRIVWKKQKISGRVCALRKSEAAIARAQRRIDQKQIRRTSKGSAEILRGSLIERLSRMDLTKHWALKHGFLHACRHRPKQLDASGQRVEVPNRGLPAVTLILLIVFALSSNFVLRHSKLVRLYHLPAVAVARQLYSWISKAPPSIRDPD